MSSEPSNAEISLAIQELEALKASIDKRVGQLKDGLQAREGSTKVPDFVHLKWFESKYNRGWIPYAQVPEEVKKFLSSRQRSEYFDNSSRFRLTGKGDLVWEEKKKEAQK